MVSLKRKLDAQGKQATIMYQDREISREKLEREDKRLKGPLRSPISKYHL